ncbi:MAG: CpsB/CapC family capsule biosynthesis tyrosine phosphatase [Rhodomicrobium sp.]
MIDLHSHLLPSIDDGAEDVHTALAMARAYVNQGVKYVACTPHILPGVYHNSGPRIRAAIALMQSRLNEAGIALRLLAGSDNHMVPNFAEGLRSGHLLTLAGSRYVLVEPPHHVAPARIAEFFFDLILTGYAPILTHPERLSWIESKYEVLKQLAARGVWMQITCGSLRGSFGRRARYWSERLLADGLVHVLATDAHNMTTRRPDLLEGYREAERHVGEEEARHLVLTRPSAVFSRHLPDDLPMPKGSRTIEGCGERYDFAEVSYARGSSGFAHRMRRILGQ